MRPRHEIRNRLRRHRLICVLIGLPLLSMDPGREPGIGWRNLAWRVTQDDVLLPVSSIEWGRPDRWSFTSRWVHMFTQDRYRPGGAPRIDSATLAVSPGTDGVRIGAGYQAIWNGHPAAFGETRLVVLRTWGKPLEARPGRTYGGVELRAGVPGVGLGLGWYRCTSPAGGFRDSFWGLHLIVGI